MSVAVATKKRVNKHTSIAYANDMAAPSFSKFDVKPSPNYIYRSAIGDIDRAQHCSRDSNTLHMGVCCFSAGLYIACPFAKHLVIACVEGHMQTHTINVK